MAIAQKWVVCEESGRWVTALRTAFARFSKVQPTPRLYEVRSLGELSSHMDETECDLTLIEVGRKNLTDVLQLLARRGPQLGQFVALLEDAVPNRRLVAATPDEPDTRAVAGLLWEVGAAEVVESPRCLRGLLSLHSRLAAARVPVTDGVGVGQSFGDWAWSTLPWQDS
jgi:hypothetical protein